MAGARRSLRADSAYGLLKRFDGSHILQALYHTPHVRAHIVVLYIYKSSYSLIPDNVLLPLVLVLTAYLCERC